MRCARAARGSLAGTSRRKPSAARWASTAVPRGERRLGQPEPGVRPDVRRRGPGQEVAVRLTGDVGTRPGRGRRERAAARRVPSRWRHDPGGAAGSRPAPRARSFRSSAAIDEPVEDGRASPGAAGTGRRSWSRARGTRPGPRAARRRGRGRTRRTSPRRRWRSARARARPPLRRGGSGRAPTGPRRASSTAPGARAGREAELPLGLVVVPELVVRDRRGRGGPGPASAGPRSADASGSRVWMASA